MNSMNPNKIKCKSCSCMRTIDQYTYSNKINKSCVKCRDKRNKNRQKPNEPNEPNEQFIRHHKLFKKLNFEFLYRAAKPVHIYNMRTIFTDIRDLR